MKLKLVTAVTAVKAVDNELTLRDLNGQLCYSLNLTAEGLQKPGQGIGEGEH